MADQTRQISAERVIDAPAERIFALLSDASRHHEIDGSGTLQGSANAAERLDLGSKFSMRMRWGIPYKTSNVVVEFEPDRRIAWCHFGRHRWRYELEPLDDGRTLVRETFDWSTALVPRFVELIGAPGRNRASIEATLERLQRAMTTG